MTKDARQTLEDALRQIAAMAQGQFHEPSKTTVISKIEEVARRALFEAQAHAS